jgi:predicted nucleic acid-binding protein
VRFARRILPFDEHVARTWGTMTAALPKGITVANMDLLIAATAQHHGLILVTRNVNDMSHFTELVVENPWQ